ncbi:hypothetical protein Trydic_g20962 [Trypoxylus dichotomus]
MNALNKLGSRTKVILSWVSGHEGHQEETVCRLYQEEEAAAVNMLCNCTALAGIWFSEMDSEYPETNTYVKGSLTKLLALVKKAKLM